MKNCLYLDDVRTPTTTIKGYHPWKVVRNYDEFVKHITQNGVPDLVSFDHDLHKEHTDDYWSQFELKGYQEPDYSSYIEKTGLDCARFLIDHIQANNSLELKQCSVHSANPIGAANIQSFINGFKQHIGNSPDCFFMKHPHT